MTTVWLALAAVAGAALSPAVAGAAPPRAGFRVALPGRFDVDQGQSGTVSLTIAPESGYTISQAGPVRVALAAEPAGGLELPRRRYQRGHAADRMADAPRFDLAVHGARAGRYRLAVEVRFWLCRGRTCRPIRVARAVAVEVRAVAAPTAPDQR